MIDDIINTFLFMLMGFQVLVFHATLPGLMLLVVAFVLGLLARGFSVCVPVFMMPMSLHERGRAIAVLTWSGLRGGISIALALTLPDTGFKDMILMMCYGVVILSILIQGLLIPAVFRALYGTEGQLEPGP